jgi:hypothetical protein
MKKVIHLKLARVSSYKGDGSANIERVTVKLEAGETFKKFIGHLRLGRYLKEEPPTVTKVLTREIKNGKYTDWKDADKKAYEEATQAVEKALRATESNNKANDSTKALKEENDKLKARLEKLEAFMDQDRQGGDSDEEIREKVIAKAKELNLTFRNDIGTANLLARVNEVEPEFDPKQ